MSGGKDKTGRQAFHEIDLGLHGLLGELGQALTDMIEHIEAGSAGEIRRERAFRSPRGPMRAEAGIRIRMGGLDLPAREPDAAAQDAPVAPTPPRPSDDSVRPIAVDVFDTAGHWGFTAELPGVSDTGLSLRVEDADLVIEGQAGRRRYLGRVRLPDGLGRDDLSVSIQNGILEVVATRGGPAP